MSANQRAVKDIIIRGGENIASEEVENVIFLDDRIAEAAAVPVPHDVLGEEVAVAVSLAPGATATAESIIALAAPRLRSPARPVFVHVHHEPLRECWERGSGKRSVANLARSAQHQRQVGQDGHQEDCPRQVREARSQGEAVERCLIRDLESCTLGTFICRASVVRCSDTIHGRGRHS